MTSQSIAITRQATPQAAKKNILLWVGLEDRPYVSKLSKVFASANIRVHDGLPEGLELIAKACKDKGFTSIVTTRLDVLIKLLPAGRIHKAKISNYTGSLIPFCGIEFLILPPLKQLVTVEYAEWLMTQLCKKVLYPEKWRKTSEFRWWLVQSGSDYVKALNRLEHCDLIAVDTETVKYPRPAIELVQYTGFKFATNESWTYVVPMTSMEAVKFMRQANALDAPKVLQNGKYDCAYFFAYSAPLTAYYYDLKNAMHAQYSELPKDLAFSSSIWIREIMYWKDLSSTGDSQDKFRYGALDTWATGEAFIAWLEQAPDYAKSNYVEEFLLVPSLHMCEMRGIKRDMPRLYEAAEAGAIKLDAILREVRGLVGSPRFNPSSPDQCVRLICAMTGTKLPDKSIKVKDMTPEQKRERQSSAEKAIVKASYQHPLNERVLGKILEYRGLRKELSTYLPVGEKAKEFGVGNRARILYSLNPDGTDSGRLASKSHHFWCGLQIQNISSDGDCKSTLIADEGFHFGEADYSQAEDRGVAYSSGDPTLLDIFERGVDSHSYKAAMFFGIPYEEIYDTVNHKTILKDIRQLGKRINHGANYNMGAQVLLETMGPKAVREAQRLLKLPARYTMLDVCKYLLACYEKAFPTVKTAYYTSIKLQIKQTKMMVSDTGWVRYCFGNPETSKPALNKYVAHKTQNLNAMILNKAWLKIFKELGFNPNFKLLAQIHDSILFQYRIGHEYLAERVKELMTFPVPITDCKGITRDLTVPVDIKLLGRTWAGTNE